MKLIVGLGNPGDKYKNTFHNIGFLAVGKIIEAEPDFSEFKCFSQCQADIAEGRIGNEKVIIAKPYSFMNNSGNTVLAITGFYKNKIKNEDLIVIHDDSDLELGKIKVSQGSGSAGHRGVQSIVDRLKTKDFIRIRIGIRKESVKRIPAEKLVLKKISKKEAEMLEKAFINTAETIKILINKGINSAKEYAGQQKTR